LPPVFVSAVCLYLLCFLQPLEGLTEWFFRVGFRASPLALLTFCHLVTKGLFAYPVFFYRLLCLPLFDELRQVWKDEFVQKLFLVLRSPSDDSDFATLLLFLVVSFCSFTLQFFHTFLSQLFLAFSSHRLRTLPFASFVSISRMSNFSSSRQFYACQVVD